MKYSLRGQPLSVCVFVCVLHGSPTLGEDGVGGQHRVGEICFCECRNVED